VIKRIDHQQIALPCFTLRPRAARMSARLARRRLKQLLPNETGFMRWVVVSSRKSRGSYKGEKERTVEFTNVACLRSSVWFVGNPSF
jgi:hypothetical protein